MDTEDGEVEVIEVDGIRNEFKGENRRGIISQYSGRHYYCNSIA